MKKPALSIFIPSKLKDLMQFTIVNQSSISKLEDIVVLIDTESQLPTKYFSKEEIGFINDSLKSDKKFIHINQYKRNIFVQKLTPAIEGSYDHLESARNYGATICSKVNALKIEKLRIESYSDADKTLAFIEGVTLSNYQFLKYRSNAKVEANKLKALGIVSDKIKPQQLNYLKIVCEAVFWVRNLVNEPQSYLTATKLGSEFTKMGSKAGFQVKVMRKRRLKN
jgi:leucyl aminopeptidase